MFAGYFRYGDDNSLGRFILEQDSFRVHRFIKDSSDSENSRRPQVLTLPRLKLDEREEFFVPLNTEKVEIFVVNLMHFFNGKVDFREGTEKDFGISKKITGLGEEIAIGTEEFPADELRNGISFINKMNDEIFFRSSLPLSFKTI